MKIRFCLEKTSLLTPKGEIELITLDIAPRRDSIDSPSQKSYHSTPMRRFMQFRILRILSLKVIECHWWWCWRLMGKLVKRIWYERRSVAAWYLIFHRVLMMYRIRWFYLLFSSVLWVMLPYQNGILALSQSQLSQITKGIFLEFCAFQFNFTASFGGG